MFCSNCGKEIRDGAKFCTRCGAKLNDVASQDNSHSQGSKAGKLGAMNASTGKIAGEKVVKKAGAGILGKIIIGVVGLAFVGSMITLMNGTIGKNENGGTGGSKVIETDKNGKNTGDYKKDSEGNNRNNNGSIVVVISLDKEVYEPGEGITVRYEGVSKQLVSDGAWLGMAGYLNDVSEFLNQEFLYEGAGESYMNAPMSPGQYQVRLFSGSDATEDNLAAKADFFVVDKKAQSDVLVGTWKFDETLKSIEGVTLYNYVNKVEDTYEDTSYDRSTEEIAVADYNMNGRLTIESGNSEGEYTVTILKYCDELLGCSICYRCNAVWDDKASTFTTDRRSAVLICKNGEYTYDFGSYFDNTVYYAASALYGNLGSFYAEAFVSGLDEDSGESSFSADLIAGGNNYIEGFRCGTVYVTKISDEIEKFGLAEE